IIASHSAVRKLANVSRNLDDEQLLALKKNGGVMQTVAFSSYVKTDSPERLAALDELRTEFDLPANAPIGGGGRGGRAPRGGRARGRRSGRRGCAVHEHPDSGESVRGRAGRRRRRWWACGARRWPGQPARGSQRGQTRGIPEAARRSESEVSAGRAGDGEGFR